MMALLSMGSDVDTVCAVYGQIAGACYGVEAIPARWKDGLAQKALIGSFADRLVKLADEKYVEQ
jgi:ADP-ribosyl-[dinitrogen reductase] hydrolase